MEQALLLIAQAPVLRPQLVRADRLPSLVPNAARGETTRDLVPSQTMVAQNCKVAYVPAQPAPEQDGVFARAEGLGDARNDLVGVDHGGTIAGRLESAKKRNLWEYLHR